MIQATINEQAQGELGTPNGGCPFCTGIAAHTYDCLRLKARKRNISEERRSSGKERRRR